MNNLVKMIEEVQHEMRAARNYSCADKLDKILKEARKRPTLTDFVDSTIVKVRSNMCDNYCKFTKDCSEAADMGEDFPCPLELL